MKIRSLLLGSVAAAGLATGASAADLDVLTSLDVCDRIGLSGLTISSETNCLQITGFVSYEFRWGDYEGDTLQYNINPDLGLVALPANDINIAGPLNDTIVSTPSYGDFTIATPGNAISYPAGVDLPDRNQDWYSKVEAWIRFVASAESDFGTARAVIKIKELQEWVTQNERYIGGKAMGAPQNIILPGGIPAPAFGFPSAAPGIDGVPGTGGDHTFGAIFDEAYVAVGDTTMIIAGKKGTLMNFGDDVPLNFTGLFNSEKTDVGVKWRKDLIPDGGHVIQVTTDLGNGVALTGVLEALTNTDGNAGTAAGILQYNGDGISAHVTVAAGGILDGVVENFGIHAGVSGSFDIVRFVAAIAADNGGYWNALASASATFDIFTLAVSGEAVSDLVGNTDFGAGASVRVDVTEQVAINLGGRWYRDASAADDNFHLAANLVAAVTESITLTGEVGVFADTGAGATVFYGSGQLGWAPGGNFTSSIKGEAFSNGAYKATFKAAKTFE